MKGENNMKTEHELFMAALELLNSLCAIGCMTNEEEAALVRLLLCYR